KKAGVFVSLKKYGNLRGCIGTTGPTTNSIADEIIQNAISAGLRDPRFPSVEEDELDKLSVSVDVLMPPESIDSIEQLDTKKYGVIVRHRGRSGLLLPNLEGIDTPQEQVNIALRKAGIYQDADYDLERFEVIRHE
ncbi:MAG: AmmeMemoRadiSam system protein A, partial [Candidatus Izimaplasma sp.]|nr:AmmeMemoRadiSam system protein A [Candidatus Izimaplasma bacterium]